MHDTWHLGEKILQASAGVLLEWSVEPWFLTACWTTHIYLNRAVRLKLLEFAKRILKREDLNARINKGMGCQSLALQFCYAFSGSTPSSNRKAALGFRTLEQLLLQHFVMYTHRHQGFDLPSVENTVYMLLPDSCFCVFLHLVRYQPSCSIELGFFCGTAV